MLKAKWQDVKAEPVNAEGAKGATIRWLIGKESGAPNFHMRLFELAPGGQTPLHTHAWEHELYILEGSGQMQTEKGSAPFAAGEFIYVAPHEKHQFVNNGSSVCRFLCLVPAGV